MDRITKINQLLQQFPPGVIFLSKWLNDHGYSYSLQQQYRKSGWLIGIGKGAMKRSGDGMLIGGAIHALQQQAGIPVHIGGRTALGIQGLVQYLETGGSETLLYAKNGINLPSWISNNSWDSKPRLIHTSFLPNEVGLVENREAGFTLKISNPARAMMECLELAPTDFDLYEAFEIMENLGSLQPDIVQTLLENCRSVKVKRLFLYFSEKAGHAWFKYLKPDRIDLGKGKRSIVKNGVWVTTYQTTLPGDLV